jgi:peptidoglycan/LPS O-acetylase OafA/YrhL
MSTLTWIGRRAYAIYLLHVIAIQAVTRVIPDGQGSTKAVIATILSLLVSLIFAEIMFRMVEQPCIRFGRSLSNKIIGGVSKDLRDNRLESRNHG